MGLTSRGTRERIRERIDMVQLVSEYVTLERRGPDDFWGCCPFHEEKSPSFHIRPSRGLFKCFGCSKGGDVFKFVEELEGIGFRDALRLLAQRAGVQLEDASPQERAREARQAELQRVSNLAAGFFEEVLASRTPAGERGRRYLAERGITPETAREFRLGVAPPEWDALASWARERRLSDEVLVELGLLRLKDGRRFDFFRERLMFPITTEQGKVVAFGGRTLADDPRKYMNSREVPGFYEKRRCLYGLDKARRARPKRLVVVEGYMDVVLPHQAGRTEFVASLGTAFTPEQARLAQRYVDEVVLLFDGDAAGAAATLRALANLVGLQGLSVKVARLPEGEDPDEVVRRDPAALDAILERAEDVIPFLVSAALDGRELNAPAGRERAIRAAIRLLARIPDPIRLATELSGVAERFRIPEADLRRELVAARQEAPRGEARGPRTQAPAPAEPARARVGELELHLLEALLALPEGVQRASERGVGPDCFSAGPARVLAEALFAARSEDGAVEPARVLDRLEGQAERDLASDLIGRIAPGKDYLGELDGVGRLLARARERRAKELLRSIQQAPDQETKNRLLTEYRSLQAQQAPGTGMAAGA